LCLRLSVGSCSLLISNRIVLEKGQNLGRNMDEAAIGSGGASAASEGDVSCAQADFDALLLEAVIKKQYQVVRAAVGAGSCSLPSFPPFLVSLSEFLSFLSLFPFSVSLRVPLNHC